jgi:hypothetical protein
VSTASDQPQARTVLREALAIAEMLAREGKLTTAQQGQDLRDRIAKLPPEQTGAQ